MMTKIFHGIRIVRKKIFNEKVSRWWEGKIADPLNSFFRFFFVIVFHVLTAEMLILQGKVQKENYAKNQAKFHCKVTTMK